MGMVGDELEFEQEEDVMLLRVDVTQDDIDQGERLECSKCPVARAVGRVLNRQGVMVTGRNISLCGGTYQSVPLPPRAYEFVRDFDHGMRVTPFTFDLTVPW